MVEQRHLKPLLFAVLAAVASASGCGGGGGSNPAPVVSNPPPVAAAPFGLTRRASVASLSLRC